ncbi:MAG: DUF3810 family protein [Candidatus Eremiobacteraeota bacterium]|nr:DUF3810 family protein [Candidatus Eremiobacteraeota bacterium]
MRDRPTSAAVRLRRSFLVDAIAIVAAIAVRLGTPPPSWIEAHYANGAYPAIDRAVRALTGPIPIDVGDVLLAIAIASLVRYWIVEAKRGRRNLPSTLARIASRTLAVACGIYVWFMFSWAFDYSRIPLSEKLALHEERTGEDSVNRFADRITDELTRAAPAAHRERISDAEVAVRLEPTFERTIRRLGDVATFAPPRIKPTVFQPLLQASATTGFTDPWTHEVNVDSSLFFFERPAIFAHEWSHVSGFNDEAEANFISVIACTTSGDPLLRYSGLLLVWENLPQGVHLTHRMGRLAYDDLMAIRARYVRNVNARVEHAGRAAYDGYLKSNHVKAGYASYGLFIRWMTAADFDRSGLPIVRSAPGSGTTDSGG